MTSEFDSSAAGAPGLQLLLALRRLPARGGVAALRGLAPWVAAALEAETTSPHVDGEIAFELARIVGGERGEHTPTSVEELALVLGEREGAPADTAARKALAPFAPELRAACARLRRSEPRGSPLHAEFVLALREASALSSRLLQAPRQAQPQGSAAPDRLQALLDPVAALRALDTLTGAGIERLRAALSEIHKPIRLDTEEALPVAEWVLLGGPRPARRPGLLELARSLDAFSARAPLSTTDRDALLALARAADAERTDPAWPLLADRVWMLRSRLLGAEKPLAPLYRSLLGHRMVARRADGATLESIIAGIQGEA